MKIYLCAFACLTGGVAGLSFCAKTSHTNFRRDVSLYSSSIMINDEENIKSDDGAMSRGAISMNVDEMAVEMGGWGRARLVWDYYRIGIDPLKYFRHQEPSNALEKFIQGVDANDSDIVNLLPNARRTQSLLGKASLDKLQELYNDYGGELEGGVAKLTHISTSADGTTKLLIELKDGLEVETVIIPWYDKGWSTICVSSQVGCKQGCTFCSTGRMGKLRNLSSTEILSQFFHALKICRLGSIPKLANVVFMGMGEPADNAVEVNAALKILTDVDLFHMGQGKVIVSTVAPCPDAFTQFKDSPCVLAWSVHAANDELRKQLVPTTKFSMIELRQGLIDTLNSRPKRLRTTMLEMALIDGVNDSDEAALELAKFAQVIIDSVPGIKLVCNLIPFNDIGHPYYKKPSMVQVERFQKILRDQNISAHVRSTRGDDESAACGQLATKKAKRLQ